MDNIKGIVKTVVEEAARRHTYDYDKVRGLFETSLETKERQHTKWMGIKGTSAFVLVDTPAWLYHIKMRHNAILKKLQEEMPDIKVISFKIGKVR